ncbi:esterase FE4-like [Schistocerca piceifrons]|uniref:esterase FE4-like n=1 Tax=Schistocerca piceifrons TaxID=274613 RepID=UPI001F5EAE78|nr:esterase FE4-like [Schistocerca piceifrons]
MTSTESGYATVCVAEGALHGRVSSTATGCKYYSFQGVPYARPPVGQLRFKPPQPPEPWTGTRDATKEGNVAPQLNSFTGQYVGDEDCLFLNVYTTKLPENVEGERMPVMVWIHGGSFTSGSGNADRFGPDHLLPHGVVVVTFNYRLGVLGFLSTEDSVLPGNLGLKDQVAALRWVRRNIAAFAGDPDNVTIFGESAGGACCHLHLFSPMTRGLFHRAILQSGAFTPLSLVIPSRERSFRLARHLELPANSSQQLLDSLMKVPARTLVENILEARSHEEKLRLDMSPFRPVLEPTDAEGGAFISEEFEDVLAKGQHSLVPVIIGVNSMEGLYQIADLRRSKEALNAFNEDLEIVLPTNAKINPQDRTNVAKSMRSFYFGDKKLSEETMQQFAEMKGDLWFVYPTLRAAKKLSTTPGAKPVYLYVFDVDGRLNVYKTLLRLQQYKGACHGDELMYLFRSSKRPIDVEAGSVEAKTINRMTRLWTNFAKTGYPTPTSTDEELAATWPAFTEGAPNYLHIANSGLTVKQSPFKSRMDFLESIYK